MLGTYFYHEIIRKTIVSFGTLFNDVYIRHSKSDGTILDETKVGLSYGPMQKFLAKIEQQEQVQDNEHEKDLHGQQARQEQHWEKSKTMTP